jgi:apolipoprotein D and lipocalin family protein
MSGLDEKEVTMKKQEPWGLRGVVTRLRLAGVAALAGLWVAAGAAHAQASSAGVAAGVPPVPLESLPALEVPPYMGTWYQVALFPNFFQRQCISDTTATYRQLPGGAVEVKNRCRNADGRMDEAFGQARPTGTLSGTTLAPARLEVSFLPAWLRWLPVGWGRYWVIQLADDGRYAVISEPTREYLWILSRQPRLSSADEVMIRARLAQQGFADLSKLQMHRHTP